ncbi:hypothetical protein [Fischerella thermalis]|uniref:hypothetical protein n=1 Tax=Fischerella thermalis TaxID=372787 RepID=UPI0011AF1EB4|nr:hypothetical protein [Fischerella thermalis]
MQKNVKHRQQKFSIMGLFKCKSLWMPTTLGWGVCRCVAVSQCSGRVSRHKARRVTWRRRAHRFQGRVPGGLPVREECEECGKYEEWRNNY